MNGRFFIDTNVFAYLYDETSPKKRLASEALIKSAFVPSGGTISFQVVQEFFSVAFRRFNPPMTPSEAEEFLALTFAPFHTVPSSYLLYQRALELTRRFSLSWYDSLIVAAALEGGCGILYSEDFQHGQQFDTVVVQNPFL
jgi:predicted nucleic acid-binding protein